MMRVITIFLLLTSACCGSQNFPADTNARTSTTNMASVYWVTTPTIADQTLLVAGAFGFPDSTNTAQMQFCGSAAPINTIPQTACSTVTAMVWNQSIQVKVPQNCGPPCSLTPLSSATTGFGDGFVVHVNTPDIWWSMVSSPASGPPSDMLTIYAGDTARVFGRGLAWSKDGQTCLAADEVHTDSGTTLTLTTQAHATDQTTTRIVASESNCYEASFPTTPIAPGTYTATLSTVWGVGATFDVVVLQQPPSQTVHVLDVFADFGGDIMSALTKASTIVMEDATANVTLMLGPHVYTVTDTLVLPNRTSILGVGATQSRISVNISSAKTKPSDVTCAKPELVDFFVTNCTAHHPFCFDNFSPSTHVSTYAECCDACRTTARCNAFTFIGGNIPVYCGLRSCADPQRRCATTKSPPGPHNRTSAWVNGRSPYTPKLAALLIAGNANTLYNFALQIVDADAETPAIWMQTTATQFSALSLNVTLFQENVSNAFKIEGRGFEIRETVMNQVGDCMWPPHGDTSPFMPSVTIYLHNSSGGVLANNIVYWQCSAFDLDVSERVVFEENTIICTNHGVVPHGNSVSGYDWRTHPASQFWSIARNSLQRPPYTPGTEQNWIQRETITTDGSGQYGTAALTTSTSTTATTATGTVVLKWLQWSTLAKVGCVLLVLAGPGTGQHRVVTQVVNNNTLVLDSPLDDWVAFDGEATPSTIGILSNFGTKTIVGNKFNWTEVVQWYGNTRLGVMADNSLSNCNVKPGGNVGASSMGAVGECYHGSDPVFFTEFYNNTMYNSDGIGLRNAAGGNGEPQCNPFEGPWIRWSVIRANHLSGISLAARNISAATGRSPHCAAVTLYSSNTQTHTWWTTDVVAEHNTFECPSEGNSSSSGNHIGACSHCSISN